MEIDENLPNSKVSRIEDCEVCGSNGAKYTCPRCELRTCSLECVRIHKKELECSGIRDKVKFKTLKDFNNIDLLNDYRFLEETARLVGKSNKLPPQSCHNPKNGNLPQDLYRLKHATSARGIQYHYLPPSFSRHRTNTSYLDHQTQNLYWRIDWVFPQAENLTLTDEKILDSSLLSACVHKYIVPQDRTYQALAYYQAAGHTGIKMLLKAERMAPNRFHLLDPDMTIQENLIGKCIIEYPVIYVILGYHIQLYNVLSEEEEQKFNKVQRGRRRHRTRYTASKGSNYFFSNHNDERVDLDEELRNEEYTTDKEETVDIRRPYYQRGRGRSRGRGRFNRNWKGGRGRGRGMRRNTPWSNTNEFNENAVNGGLSSRFNAVNIQSY